MTLLPCGVMRVLGRLGKMHCMKQWLAVIFASTMLCRACAGDASPQPGGVWPLQARIDALAESGGGTLTLPAGTYRTGALFFKPGVNLHLEKGAEIVGTDDAEGYPMRETRIEGETCLYYPALVNADGCDGFTISGEGVIDGHGANTWEEFWTKRAAARKKGGDFRNKDLMRPRVLYVSHSKNVDVSGVTFKNSKFWTTHFYDCEDVTVHDCEIRADILKDSQGKELKGPSTDGIDVDKCNRFTIRNVTFSVNDDGVAIKGGKGPWADDYAKFPGNGPSTDVLIENCTFRHPTHSALTLGSECPAATNITMRGCVMDGCGNMLNLKMRTDTPQHYANVLVEDCRGKCDTFLCTRAWSQYHDAQGRSAEELKSFADGVTLRNNVIDAARVFNAKKKETAFELSNLVMEGNVVNGKKVESPSAAKQGQWEAGMDDDAGKAAATSQDNLPGADYEGARKIYPKRDRLFTTSLDGTWAFKLVNGLGTPDELKGWNEPGYDTREWDDIAVPGNWETQGLKSPQYGNQIDEMSGFYVRRFRWNPSWEGQRVILRFDGVLFGYEVWLNGKYVGRWGSAYNLAQWDVTDKLVKGRNTIAVKVMTRSRGWLFDTNDCWALAGIFRSVELFTVPNDYIEDIVFRTEEVDLATKNTKDTKVTAAQAGLANGASQAERTRVPSAKVTVMVEVGVFDGNASRAKKVYVSLVDDNGVHVLDFERVIGERGTAAAKAMAVESGNGERGVECRGVVANAHLWSVEDPYLYTLVVTLVDAQGKKIERIAEKQGLRVVKLVDRHLEINGKQTFLNGVAWNEIDPVLGRAITETERRKQMTLMKKAGVNCIRTAHYPFGPDFLRLADEMGFYVIDEIPFGSRGAPYLKNAAYRDELLMRTEATMRRDKNFASVIFWTFGNENSFTPNTEAVLAYAKKKDPTRPRGLPQIGSSQAKETMYHPERDVDFIAPHYLSPENMKEYEKNAAKPLVQTEFAHACGNGFNDFEDRYRRMRERPDVWMGGCVWAWIDQSIMHPDSGEAFEKELSLTRTVGKNGDLPKDMRRDMPREFQGNYVDERHFIDSWGDRATDGIVYGDGTPKDGYWLVRALYGERGTGNGERGTGKGEGCPPSPDTQLTTLNSKLLESPPLLRIGRKMGMDQKIQTLSKRKPYSHSPYLLKPEVKGSKVQKDGSFKYVLRYTMPEAESRYIEGVVVISNDGAKASVSYDFTPSARLVSETQFVELGLTFEMPEMFDRVDWEGLGPLTSVPGKSKMNSFGKWAMHKDDYRFLGNRGEVKWAGAGGNRDKDMWVLESGTGNVSFENVEGHVLLTENMAVAGYGGKASGPSGLKSPKDVKMKGSFKVYNASSGPFNDDIVPDLTYTHHYGF